MRRLIKRSGSMGYKGMDKIAREVKRRHEPSNLPAMSNPFIGDQFFKENPTKVLGKQTTRKGRFGDDMIVVEGGIDAVEKIDAHPVPVVDLYPQQDLTQKPKAEIIEQVFEAEMQQEKNRKIKSLRTGKKQGKSVTPSQEIYSFQEINTLYNKQISRDELEAYYFTHPELDYKLLFDKYTNTKTNLIRKGLICWDAGKFVYVYTYQSGNISQKISHLKRDREKIIAELGQGQYEIQLKMLEDVRPKAKGLMGNDRITILPHSNFAKENKIMELRFGKPELRGETSILMAFKYWLIHLSPDNFKKATNREIIDYYLDNKNIPIDKNAPRIEQEKQQRNAINTRQRTKEEGDELFARFLAEELIPEDQQKLTFFWNEKFNSIAEPNLSKIPVCFQISKTFKAGAPLLLNPTQRQAVAFMMEKKSGLFAYGVGVGKTLSAITCLSQAWYNNLAQKFLFVVPTNTYDKWIGELQGYTDRDTGQFMQGALPQFPSVVGLYNLNPLIVRDKIKRYSTKDELYLQSIEDAITLLKEIEEDRPNDKQRNAVSKIYNVNWPGLEAHYAAYLGTTKSASPKKFTDFAIEYLKDEYNYYVYQLGEIKNFPDGTIFVTTEVGLQRLGVKETVELELFLYQVLSQGELTGDKGSKRDIAGLQLKIEQTISSSLKNAKLYVEDFGFNWVCFDESHYYKKIFTFVKGQIIDEVEDKEGNIKYKRDKSKYELKSGSYPSSRALSAFVLSHYIQRKNNNRNVIQLTATPFTNSPLEVFSMLTLTNYRELSEMGLANMVDFFDTFMRINYDIKYTPQKTVVKDVVLTGYNNLPQLRQIIYTLMDKKDEGANLKRPTKIIYPSVEKGIETTLPMTVEQDELMRDVKSYINGNLDYDAICKAALEEEIENTDFDGLDDETLITEWERVTGKEFEGEREGLPESRREALASQIKNSKSEGLEMDLEDLSEEESVGVRVLRGLSMMRQITLSPYLFHKACRKAGASAPQPPNYKEYIETSPKLKYVVGCIKSAIDFHKKNGQKISGQVIYMNAGVEYFTLIREYLVKVVGLRDSQVGIVSGGMSKSAKENVKQRFLSGDILVLIGSSTIAVGVDLQNNSTTLYNCYYDWNPTDAAQIEGRIWRQGNRFAYVRIVYPQCYNSADPVIFEYLNQKTLRINEIWNRSSEVQELDLRDFNPKELQKKLITDPEELADWQILEETDTIQTQIIYYENRRESLEKAIMSFRRVTELRPKVVKWLNELSAIKLQTAREEAIENQKEKITAIEEKYGDDPEKMAAEIAKYKGSRYDYENDPEGKFAVVDYTTAGDEKINTDSKKYLELAKDWTYRDEPVWKDAYYSRSKIESDLFDFRAEYKYMKMAEASILTPMGLSFDTAENPIGQFDSKINELRGQLESIELSKPDRVKRLKEEFAAMRHTIKTVQDRVEEFAADNEKYLTPQLIVADTKPIEMPKPAPEEMIVPAAEEKLKKEVKPKAPAAKQKPAPVATEKVPAPAAVPAAQKPATVNKEVIKKQIKALEVAQKFAAAETKPKLEKQIKALTISLKFAA